MANSSIYAAFERMWQHVVSVVGNKSDVDHSHDDKYYTESEIDVALEEVKSYADTAASNVKNDLLNGAGEAYDTLKELGELIDENVGAIDALENVTTGKADKDHSHNDYETKEDAQVKYDEITNAKADWAQNDETAIDYIKNKPSSDDALALAAEMELIVPVVTDDGLLFADENGKLYLL